MNESLPATVLLSGTALDPAAIGGTADSLNRLIAAGVRVPMAGSITTAGYRRFVECSGLGRECREKASDLARKGMGDVLLGFLRHDRYPGAPWSLREGGLG